MKKVLLSLAATLILVAGFATSADAQRRGPGVYRGGGGGSFVGVRGGGYRVAGAGIRRAGFVGGPRYWGPRRFVGAGAAFLAAGAYGGYYGGGYGGGYYGAGYYGGGYGGCLRWRVVATPWGPQYRQVNVCYAPVGYGYGYGYRAYPVYPVGYYGAVY